MKLHRLVSLVAAGATAACDFPATSFADMHDGDFKQITVFNSVMTILPYNNTETWTVTAPVDPDTCTASIDFRVPGKPGPPPCALTATIYRLMDSQKNEMVEVIFTDTSGSITDDPKLPLNAWVGLKELA